MLSESSEHTASMRQNIDANSTLSLPYVVMNVLSTIVAFQDRCFWG